MKNLITFLVLLFSSAVFADPCGTNCVSLKLNEDVYNDKVEFVVGIHKEGQSNLIHALNLKTSLSTEKTTRKYNERVTLRGEDKWVYTEVTDSAYVGTQWTLNINEKTKVATVQWYTDDSSGSLATARYQLNADGTATLLK